jgi:hypothetical protein
MKLVRPILLPVVCVLLAAPAAHAQGARPAAKPAPAAKAAGPAGKLPAPILAAFRTAYPNAAIKNAAKETEDGKTVWEVESIDNGLARDLVYNSDGAIAEVEEQIEPASLPAAVSATLQAKYPKATVTKAERLTKGTTLTYEMTLKGASAKSVEITPEGKIVPAAKEEDDKEDAPKKK